MVTSNIREVRLNLSKFLKLVEQGQEIIIKNRNTPIARIVPYVTSKDSGFPDLSEFRKEFSYSGEKNGKPTIEDCIRSDRDTR